MNWTANFDDAVREAHRRAWVTRLRYRVRYDARNGWWNLTETTMPIVGG